MAEPDNDAEGDVLEADAAFSDVEGEGAAAVGDDDPSLVGPGARKVRGALGKVLGLRGRLAKRAKRLGELEVANSTRKLSKREAAQFSDLRKTVRDIASDLKFAEARLDEAKQAASSLREAAAAS